MLSDDSDASEKDPLKGARAKIRARAVASATLTAGKEAVRANGERRPPRSRGLPCSARAATQRSAMPMETMTWINWRSTTRIGNYSAACSGLMWEVEGMGQVRTSLSIGNTRVS